MKLIFMGTSEFAVPALRAIYQSTHNIDSVFTKEPQKSGRGYQIQNSPVHEVAEALNLKVFTPRTLKTVEVEAIIRASFPDIIVVASYGHIVPQSILDIPKYGCINIHPSLLPRWRGAAPIERSILAGDQETAVCIMKMNAGLDTGDVLSVRRVRIDPADTTEVLTSKLSRIGAEMLISILDNILHAMPIKQSEVGITYAAKLRKEEGVINWEESAEQIDRMVKALNPWPGCFFKYKNEYIKLLEAEVVQDVFEPSAPGTVLTKDLTICCGNGAISLRKLQRQGKKALGVKDFLNGTPILVGSILS